MGVLQGIVKQYERGALTVDELMGKIEECMERPVRQEYACKLVISDTLRSTDSIMLSEQERVALVLALETSQKQGRIISFALHTHRPLTYEQLLALVP